MRVLVVDDDPAVRLATIRLLEQDGHTCMWAGTGEYALSLAATESPDVALLDVDLGPGSIDGIDVARRLPRSLPVIIVSGFSTEEIYHRAHEVHDAISGAIAILGKPLDADTLLRHLAALRGTVGP